MDLNHFLNPLLTEFYPKIDIILIGFYFNDKVVGIYSIASIFIEGLTQISMIFTTNLNPRFSRLYKKNKKELLIKLIKKVFINIALIIFTIVLFLFYLPIWPLIFSWIILVHTIKASHVYHLKYWDFSKFRFLPLTNDF